MLEIFGWDESDFRCVPCLKAKRLAESRGLIFDFIPLAKEKITEQHAQNRSDLETRMIANGKALETLPQVFFNGNLIGGFDDFKASIHELEKRRWENK
ncbi:glutaredoxin [Vibrio phage 1.081.O._10N.286.52.C2]|nr:glutaredoxin [Vibrio phage 1.081.O._10N.286.52.C2]